MEKKKTVNELIKESGIITHYKTVNKLKTLGWEVFVSPYYFDVISDTVKEIDIIAEKPFYSVSDAAYSSKVQINVQLFLECKYIKNEIGLWFDNINRDNVVSKLEKITNLPLVYGSRSQGFSPDKFHYFRYNKTVKLFTPDTNKEDIIYKAITQCLNAQTYHQDKGRTLHFHFSGRDGTINNIIRYPMIVCDKFDKLQEIELSNGGDIYKTKPIENIFALETNYSAENTGFEYSLIDVVDFNYLEKFLDELGQEAKDLVGAYVFKGRR
ncbi:hypothetical protein HZB93_03805 [Candidatus Falkowbacteria bacterium]|nr:hypothetical protein [Candidatus Falkowbacteria bacterium]